MLEDQNQPERPVVMATGPIAGAGAAQSEGAVTLPRLGASGFSASLPWPRFRVGRRTCQVVIAVLVLGDVRGRGRRRLRPLDLGTALNQLFPNWEAGPLHTSSRG